MKKKIAVFAVGWSGDNLYNYVKGICEGVKHISADVYVFIGYPILGTWNNYMRGELNIVNLPDMREFDIAAVDAIGLNFPGVLDGIYDRCSKAGVPVVNTVHDDGIHYFIGTDNEVGERELARHLITVHGARDIFFIAGRSDNDDSNTRLRVLSEVMSNHGLKLSEDRIYYSDWAPNNAKDFIREWFRQGREIPDAFVCANDELAMVICSELRKLGVKVPEDVIVTGFDNEYMSSIFDPAISSVNQRFDKIGNKVAELAVRLFHGEPCERSQIISCEFYPSESCGCMAVRDFDGIRRELGRNKFLELLQLTFFNRSFAELERKVLKGKEYSDIRENMKIILNTVDNYEGDSFHVVLDPLFEKATRDSNIKLRESGYPEKMDVVFSMDCKNYKRTDDFMTKDIVPYIKDETKNHLFLCTPLHDDGASMGYAVFGDNIELLKDVDNVRVYLDRLNDILSKYKQTLSLDFLSKKLLLMSETDALTHVKNRMAYHTRKEQLNAELKIQGDIRFAIALFDINGLKQINDTFGHEAGDEYIINSCKLICETFKHSAVYRIGGDEFIALLIDRDYESRQALLDKFKDKMLALKEKDLPSTEKVSIACGLADYEPGRDGDADAVLHRADLKMYEDKHYMKMKK